jgi:hypothetical protein
VTIPEFDCELLNAAASVGESCADIWTDPRELGFQLQVAVIVPELTVEILMHPGIRLPFAK